MRRNWRVTAEINMDASQVKVVDVCTNTKRKAMKLAEQKLTERGTFFVWVMFCEPMEEV